MPTRADQSGEPVGRVIVQLLQNVGIRVGRDADRGVSEHAADHLQVRPARQHHGRGGVTQIMEPKHGQAG